jgi:hypothetical protein
MAKMQRDWRELWVAVTNKSDPTTLGPLIHELLEALDKGAKLAWWTLSNEKREHVT